MGIAESALAQHRKDISAIIAECPGKLRIGSTIIDVCVDMPSLTFAAEAEGVLGPITFSIIGPSTSLPRALKSRDMVEIMPFGEAGYSQYYVVDFRMDSVEFTAMLQTAKSSNNSMRVA